MSYVKLFESILDSTVWQEDLHVKVVWITMLAMKDIDGVVHASIPGLAKRAGVTTPQCEEALAKFLGPDPYSRTKTNDGRRIAEVDGGWEVLNHDKYRDLLDADDQRAKAAERMRRYRERKRDVTVTPSDARDVTVRHADPDAEDQDLDLDLGSSRSPPEPPDPGAVVGAERDRVVVPTPVPPEVWAERDRIRGEIPNPGLPAELLNPPDPPPGTHAKFLRSTQVPHDPEAPRRRRKLITDAWNYAILAHNQLRVVEHIDEHVAEPWPIAPGGSYPPLVELEKRIDELIAGFGLEKAGVKIRNRVDVAATAARRDQTLKWFTPSRMWDAKPFAHDVELSPKQVETRAGPRAVPNPRPDPERRPSKKLG